MHERFQWAEKILSVKPRDEILEIGCGSGLLLNILAGQITTGKIVAIDKSAKMLSSARKRNSEFIDAGKIELIEAAFPLTLSGKFDKVIAFNVSAFWSDNGKSLAGLKGLLKRKGRIYVFYQPPVEKAHQIAEEAIKFFESNGATILNVSFKRLRPASAFCIEAII